MIKRFLQSHASKYSDDALQAAVLRSKVYVGVQIDNYLKGNNSLWLVQCITYF
jgi:hypothetical protein